MNQQNTIQKIDEIERNPIGLPTIAAKEISESLDKLVSSFSVQFHQYLKHHWLVEGPEHRDLHKFFEEIYELTKEHMDAVAERMTTLGAVPSSSLRAQAAKSFLESEIEGMIAIRQMLESDLANEQSLVAYTREAIMKANKLSDYGTETLLKGILMSRENQAHEIVHYLSRDSLAKETQEKAVH